MKPLGFDELWEVLLSGRFIDKTCQEKLLCYTKCLLRSLKLEFHAEAIW